MLSWECWGGQLIGAAGEHIGVKFPIPFMKRGAVVVIITKVGRPRETSYQGLQPRCAHAEASPAGLQDEVSGSATYRSVNPLHADGAKPEAGVFS